MLQDKAFASRGAADQITNMEALLDVVGLLGVKDVKASLPMATLRLCSRSRRHYRVARACWVSRASGLQVLLGVMGLLHVSNLLGVWACWVSNTCCKLLGVKSLLGGVGLLDASYVLGLPDVKDVQASSPTLAFWKTLSDCCM